MYWPTLLAVLAVITSTAMAHAQLACPSGQKASCAPGGNFDLRNFKLQLPIGQLQKPDEIDPTKLQGCAGYQDKNLFYTDPGDCAIVMKVPGSAANSGCVTTPNSKHCRTEFREINPESWSPNGPRNRLNASIAVPKPDNGPHGTIIGQVHIVSDVSKKPACLLYYNTKGEINVAVRKDRTNGEDAQFTSLGTVKVGERFAYQIVWEGGKLSVSINGGALKALDTFALDSPTSYFKVGNYNQGDIPSEVHVFEISTEH